MIWQDQSLSEKKNKDADKSDGDVVDKTNNGKASNRTAISNSDKEAQDYDKPAKVDKAADKVDKKSKKEAEEPFDPWAKYAVNESAVPAPVTKMLKKKVPMLYISIPVGKPQMDIHITLLKMETM